MASQTLQGLLQNLSAECLRIEAENARLRSEVEACRETQRNWPPQQPACLRCRPSRCSGTETRSTWISFDSKNTPGTDIADASVDDIVPEERALQSPECYPEWQSEASNQSVTWMSKDRTVNTLHTRASFPSQMAPLEAVLEFPGGSIVPSQANSNESEHLQLPPVVGQRSASNCSSAASASQSNVFIDEPGQDTGGWSRSSRLFARFQEPRDWNRMTTPHEKLQGLVVLANNAFVGCILSPVTRGRILWDVVMILQVAARAWFVSFYWVFMRYRGLPDWLFVIKWTILSAVGIADLAMNFCTAYIDGEKIVRSHGLIAQRYMRTWFSLDLLATMPWGIFFPRLEILEVLSLVRLARLPRYVRYVPYLTFCGSRTLRFHLGFEMWAAFVGLLLMLAHVHGCIFAWTQDTFAREGNEGFQSAIDAYGESLIWASTCMLSDTDHDCGDGHHAQRLFLAAQRAMLLALIISILSRRTSMKVLRQLRSDSTSAVSGSKVGADSRMSQKFIKYLQERDVDPDLRLRVMLRLRDAHRVKNLQSRAAMLEADDLTPDLKRDVCHALWSDRLISLELIRRVIQFQPTLASEISFASTEQVFPAYVALFHDGEVATGAYYIIEGHLGTARRAGPDETTFEAGMWVGEKSLVNVNLKRSSDCRTLSVSTLLFVPAVRFRELVDQWGLRQWFEELCADEVCRGICGRCGSLGDHFSTECPGKGKLLNIFPKGSTPEQLEPPLIMTGRISSTLSSAPSEDHVATPQQPAPARPLLQFLAKYQLEYLQPALAHMGVSTLADLKAVDIPSLKVQLSMLGLSSDVYSSDELLAYLAADNITSFQTELGSMLMGGDGSPEKKKHFIFLSHAKAEAGIECELIRVELQKLVSDSILSKFEAPVFLDTEDLQNLEQLQQHVRDSSNVALILTASVLTRPWCLVEIATAVEAGIRVLPIELAKKGVPDFQYPDEAFYQRLRAGQLLNSSGMAILRECYLEVDVVERSLRAVFKQISLPYSAFRSAQIREAELKAFLKQCRVKGRGRREMSALPGPVSEIEYPDNFRWQLS